MRVQPFREARASVGQFSRTHLSVCESPTSNGSLLGDLAELLAQLAGLFLGLFVPTLRGFFGLICVTQRVLRCGREIPRS